MNKFFLLMATALCMAHSIGKAQEYKPFVEEGKQWVEVFSDYLADVMTPEIYVMTGDTLIDGNLYKHVYLSEQADLAYLLRTGFCMREEDGKVFRRMYDETFDRLVFDYGMGVGDSCEVSYKFSAGFTRFYLFKVVGIEMVNDAQGEPRRCHEVEVSYRDGDETEYSPLWITRFLEGIGDEQYPISEPFWAATGSGHFFNHCRDGAGRLLYVRENPKEEYLNITGIAPIRAQTAAEGQDGRAYNLRGQRIAAPPARGLYIMNGRKRMR